MKKQPEINVDEVARFDMARPVPKCRWYLKPVAWLIAFPSLIAHRTKITKIGMDGLKPPYVLLGNHNAFFDMKVSARATFPHFANYVVAIDGYIGREGLLRNIGCICKRKFTSDLTVVRHLAKTVKNGGIAAIYPEARYSLCGTPAPLPESIGSVCRMLGVPVVTLICHGHHINHPFWNTRHERGVKPTVAEMKQIVTAEEIKTLTADEINDRILAEFKYDDFAWQKENHVKVDCPDRAVGLEKILYQCPACGTEFEMESSGSELRCRHCGRVWTMSEYGELSANDGETFFSHIPDWYEWERANVRREVEEGRYSSGELPVKVESLPNAERFIPIGEGTLVHDMNGFSVRVTDSAGRVREMKKTVKSLYSCHVEYEYLFKHGDCVDLNTLTDTWYIYPYGKPFSVTKMALATEELYFAERRREGKPVKEGLA